MKEKAGTKLEDVISIAADAHYGQVDKSGQPYVLHPLRVMMKVATPAQQMAAVLHDVVEDTDLTLSALKKAGVPEDVIAAVDALTKRRGETYADYLARVKANPIAMAVKRADLEDNTKPARFFNLPPEKQVKLKKKYENAFRVLFGERVKIRVDRTRSL